MCWLCALVLPGVAVLVSKCSVLRSVEPAPDWDELADSEGVAVPVVGWCCSVVGMVFLVVTVADRVLCGVL